MATRQHYSCFCVFVGFVFTLVKNTWFQGPPSTIHTFPFSTYWNKLYVGHTHHFNLFSELFVKCLQSHINLNARLKYLLRKCAEQCRYLTFTHSTVAGCDTASLAYSPCSVMWQSYHLSELWHLGLSLLCPKIHTVCRNL